ncbi:MAG TPA: NAD(P)-dependent alcohol dehydrogenase [Chthoniobacterales bacterium]|nr:NAD(P)-dependent alcohol dehydrogenase [Chthoniobacterales bacterium]
MTANTKGYAAPSAKSPLEPLSFARRDVLPNDVKIDILFCGVCHSDIHTARDEWGGTTFPCVPGHEIAGRVVAVGREVKKFKEGDLAAVGCMVDACRDCHSCHENLEQFCEDVVFTYNSPDEHTGGVTYGGYSTNIVVDENFVLRVRNDVDLAASAPLLCAGITTYSPLRHWKVGKGHKVGIVGLGGLGHMGVKFASAFGAEVTLFTTSPGKAADAKRFGAHDTVISKDEDAMKARANTFDFILDTVSANHDLDLYLSLLKRDGTLTLVGLAAEPISINPFSLVRWRHQLAGSLIGGIAETQEMLDFCADRGITCDVEKIKIDYINEAYERMLRSDVKYRFVIDIASLK